LKEKVVMSREPSYHIGSDYIEYIKSLSKIAQ